MEVLQLTVILLASICVFFCCLCAFVYFVCEKGFFRKTKVNESSSDEEPDLVEMEKGKENAKRDLSNFEVPKPRRKREKDAANAKEKGEEMPYTFDVSDAENDTLKRQRRDPQNTTTDDESEVKPKDEPILIPPSPTKEKKKKKKEVIAIEPDLQRSSSTESPYVNLISTSIRSDTQ